MRPRSIGHDHQGNQFYRTEHQTCTDDRRENKHPYACPALVLYRGNTGGVTVGIGFNLIGRKVGEEIKKFIQLILEARKDDNRTALLYNSAGEDSVPLNDERIILVKIDGAGKYAAVGVLTPSRGAKPGEKIFFARGPDAEIVSKISMLNDGSITVDTDTETTGDAAGNYTRKIKGATTIHEKGSRTYKNDKDVGNTIGGNKTEEVTGNYTIDVDGDFKINATGKVSINGTRIDLN
jgi:hypothetical protein